jgi:hypothetical protein
LKARKTRSSQQIQSDDLAAQMLLRIADLFLRGGIDAPIAERMLRKAFVQAALEKVRATGLRPTQSNIASIAGITRLEVRSILRGNSAQSIRQSTRIEQILAGWQTDSLFLDKHGNPKKLRIRARKGSFEQLARKYGRDVTPRTLLDQLVRLKLVDLQREVVSLLKTEATQPVDVAAVRADLRFLTSQLANLSSHKRRRTYVVRQSVIAARDLKSAGVAKRIAVERLETVLDSMNEISADRTPISESRNKRLHRILVSAVVATESEDTDS